MEPFSDVSQLCQSLKGVIGVKPGGKIVLLVPSMFRGELVDRLVRTVVFGGHPRLKKIAAFILRAAALQNGIWFDSIHKFYMECATGKIKPLTVPAFNIRGLTFHTARMLFRAARRKQAGVFIFELAPTEMNYTDQNPLEFSSCVIGAALREQYSGPVFVQGDHFKYDSKRYEENSAAETKWLSDLILECIDAGFFNIDCDGSGLVDLSQPTIELQQKPNVDFMMTFINLIRGSEPESITMAIGGEIGEIGKELSTVEELRGFMNSLNQRLHTGKIKPGICKISVQVGSTHGGVVDHDGQIKKVEIDQKRLKELSETARSEFHLSGGVMHGASTLPRDVFSFFPESHTIEIHLGTGLQNILFDHEMFPSGLHEEIHSHLEIHHAKERKKDWSDDQFYYKLRKKAWGPFKKAIWSLDERTKQVILTDIENEFLFFIDQLAVSGTEKLIKKLYPSAPEIPLTTPSELLKQS
ncbi:class II fructose-bisphosphate aldolase [bacterium]|nr:class II fructose-bisphosphate aldolase [candidate division CSSED10-310 bacterium]